MSFSRFMRIMIMFDLPMETTKQRRDYTHFRKFLIKNGFIMMQQSIYTKIALNSTMMESISARVKSQCPSDGVVQMMTITEKQFAGIQYICGASINTTKVDNMDRLVIL